MSQNVQFMKVNIVNINPNAVATFLLTQIICATPMTSPRAVLAKKLKLVLNKFKLKICMNKTNK